MNTPPKIIEIIVTPNGETKIETKGFTGNECRQASRFVEKALGARVNETTTPEFHQDQPNHQVNQQRE